MKSFLQRSVNIFTLNQRQFSRFAKGSFGKEGSMAANSGFPKHKELFNDGYYNGERSADQIPGHQEHMSSHLNDRMERSNTRNVGDGEQYGIDNQRANLNIKGGILKNYKKLQNQTVEDVLHGDYWRSMEDLKEQSAQYFMSVTSDEKDMMNHTKNYTMRHRLNRELQFTDDFRKKYMVKDYGNYEKYERNTVHTIVDESSTAGYDRMYENYMQLIKRLPTREAKEMEDVKKQDIEAHLHREDIAHQEFGNQYFEWKVEEEKSAYLTKALEEEDDFLNDPLQYEAQWNGRMSPFVKEIIFREYSKGMSIKDLSLKYGILQQRVKAIVFQKHLYWHEVYPRLGETHMRLAVEREAMYASDFPFVEYGQDLHTMAELEKGVKVTRMTSTEYDADPPEEAHQKVNKFIMKYRSRVSDRVPLELHGKGPGGYLLQEWVLHRGKGAPRVSTTFKELTRHYGKESECFLKKKHVKRMNLGGLRYASLGAKNSVK